MNQPSSDNLSGWEAYKRLLVYVRRYWLYFLVSVIGFALYAATQAAFAGLMEFLPAAFDQSPADCACAIESKAQASGLTSWFSPSGPEELRIFLPTAVIVIIALRGIGSYLGGFYIVLVARNVVNQLRRDLFEHMLRLPGSFYSQNASGHLISMLTFNVEQVTGAATDALKVIVREGLTVVVLLGYIFYLNWKLSLVFFAVGPLIGLVVGYASKLFRRYSRRIQDSMGGVTHTAAEAIKGYEVVKTFGGDQYETERFKEASEYNLRQSLKMARVNEISTPIIQFLMFSAIAMLFWFGLSPDLMGDMDAGKFLAYITAASLVAKPLRQLSSVNNKIQRGIAAAQSVFEVIDSDQEIDKGRLGIEKAQGRIQFDQVSFRYPGAEEPALQGVSLSINPGETVAFVGRSGSGKTTLVNLIPRFNDGIDGRILIDDQPLVDYRLSDLRRQIAIVNQKVVLFQDSIARNIAYGDLADAPMQDIREAATAAHAAEFIDTLPKGMDTLIGEDGSGLSGGQRQRLAIARAILKNAPILILDEATSALDTESERYIQDAMKTVMKGRTTLVIAHRLSTIETADKIVVMDKGRIVETGSHQELLAKEGMYAQLHKMQFAEQP